MPLLPQTTRHVDELVADAQARGRVPSLIAAVIRDGAVAHHAAAGELPAPHPDLQYRLGSITKTFTATLVLQLRDEGRLHLDDPLRKYLADTPLGALTIRSLLGHASGLQREPDGEWWERSPGVDAARLLVNLTGEKISHPPYLRYHYSNLAYGVLGALIGRMTGERWATLVAKRLLEPLGMDRTTYHPEEPFARGYVVHPWQGTLREEPRHDSVAMAPAGQMWSTISDLGRWAAFLADPDPAVLAPATVGQMCAPVVMNDLDAWTSGHGLGVELWRRGDRIYAGHTGSMPGYLAVLAVHRPSRTGVVGFANAYTLRRPGGIGGFGRDLLDAVLSAEPARPKPWRPGAAPPAEVEALTGRWWWMGREYEMCWHAPSRGLVMREVDDTEVWRLAPEGRDRWRCHGGDNDGEIMMVRRNRAGAVTALDIATFVFTRDPWAAP